MKLQIALAGVLVVACPVLVQAQAGQAPKPGPEHKKLGVFLGSWSFQGDFKAGNAYGVPAGPLSRIERYQWLPGEFFLQANREGKFLGGEDKDMIVFGYSPVARKHTGTWFGLSGGGSMSAAIANNGNTWLWSGTGHSHEGKPYHERCTTTVMPNVSYTTKCETSSDGKTWAPAFEGKATKSRP
ncbi:MAG: DUF1579 domain-containing protein [Acidobacteria bacterium]|nr:DUF1579 domain-containing protein [Acidobacteriota bacterium]